VFVTFGCGDVYINPIAGNLATNPTPEQILGLQDVSIEIDQKLVELKGANKGPDDVATGEMTVKGKCAMGRIDMDLLNQAYFADTITAGQTTVQVSESHVAAASVTVTFSSAFSKDLGVRYGANAQPLQRVLAGPLPGQYTVSAGTYTFNATDVAQGHVVLISYGYTQATTGKTLTVHNQLMGYGPVVEMYLWEPYNSILNLNTENGWHLYACRFGKTSAPMKRADFTYPAVEFESFPNAGGQWFDLIDGTGF